MPSFHLFLCFLSLCTKKPMDANLSYPRIIEDYKKHLRDFTDNHLSFESFCLPYHVRVKSVRQWMRRHGLDVSSLYYEVLLEKCNSDPDFVLPSAMGSRRNHCNNTDTLASSSQPPHIRIDKRCRRYFSRWGCH